MKKTLLNSGVALLTGGLVAACTKSGSSYSLLATGQSFKQATINSKTDLLFVIDNSSSMTPLQQNLTGNFNAFMSQFVAKGYDFQLAVTTTDAYTAASAFRNDPSMARFRDGVSPNLTNVFLILPSTPNVISTFVTNASQGVGGSGDERAFSSFREALNSSLNGGFVRPDAFLGIVILSDEDDFSSPTRAEGDFSAGDHDYDYPSLEPVSTYVSYLDGLTRSTGATRRYSVSAIAVLDETCRAQHAQQASSTCIGQRYMDLVNQTGGTLGSVCDASFASALDHIQSGIVQAITQFYLAAEPNPDTLQVSVNGALVARDATNGWSYDAGANSIVFHGAAVPSSGSAIGVAFTPLSAF